MTVAPHFSVVVPVRNGGEAFGICLEALRRSHFRDFELIVVDDGSRDGSADRAEKAGARVLSTPGGRGPAAARNLGARHARGTFLLFLDADCEVGPDTLEVLARTLGWKESPSAAFGSYDDAPAAVGFVAQYKNLVHHYVHQRGREEASTFWAGCGAVRRSVFLELGGFDERRYARPSIEDIELGRRLKAAGHRIVLARDAHVKHHKRWSLGGLVRTDVFRRGVPWTELILGEREIPDDLNLRLQERACVAAAWLLLALAAFAAFTPQALYGLPVPAAFLIGTNRDLYGFFRRKRGHGFALRAAVLHLLYYLYSGAALAIGTARYVLRPGRDGPPRRRLAPLVPSESAPLLAGDRRDS